LKTNQSRIITAISRLNNAENHLKFLMTEKKGFNKKAIKWNIDTTLYEIRNARTLLKNIEYTKYL
jgi:hypothetical protein